MRKPPTRWFSRLEHAQRRPVSGRHIPDFVGTCPVSASSNLPGRPPFCAPWCAFLIARQKLALQKLFGMAHQLIATKAAVRRGPSLWMACANSSLPFPSRRKAGPGPCFQPRWRAGAEPNATLLARGWTRKVKCAHCARSSPPPAHHFLLFHDREQTAHQFAAVHARIGRGANASSRCAGQGFRVPGTPSFLGYPVVL